MHEIPDGLDLSQRPTKTRLSSIPPSASYTTLAKSSQYTLGVADLNIAAHSGILAAGDRISPDISPSVEESDSALAHDILWEHFGFIPYDLSLDQEAYKLRPPLSLPLPGPRVPSFTPYHHHRRSRTTSSVDGTSLLNMAKKRRSLSSILVPSFLPQASASTSTLSLSPLASPRASSSTLPSASTGDFITEGSSDWLTFYSGATSPSSEHSSFGPVGPSRNSPPPDLLDEDPFANLSPAPSLRPSRASSPIRSVFEVFDDTSQRPPPTPLSPLSQSALEQEDGARRARSLRNARSSRSIPDSTSTPPPSPIDASHPRSARRPKSSGPPQVRPAYTRPAFTPRPSLPSLNALASTTVPAPKVRRGRPGAQLPLEPWEDSAPSGQSEPPSPTNTNFVTSPVPRRRTHLRRPTLSMIRDSRMYSDGESAEHGGLPYLEASDQRHDFSLEGASDSARRVDEEEQPIEETSASSSAYVLESEGDATIAPEAEPNDQAHPPTPPPKSPTLSLHTRTASVTSAGSTVPSLCPSSPRLGSPGSPELHLHRSPRRPHSPLPPLPASRPRVHVDTDDSGHPGYPDVFAHHRHTQLLTSDLLAALEYNYSDALSHLGTTASRTSPSSLYPSGDFEPGSSAGTVKNVVLSHVQSEGSDEGASMERVSSGDSNWDLEVNDLHDQLYPRTVPPSLFSPPELESSSSEDISAENGESPSPALSRSRSSSTVSSEYDFADEDDVYYSYDIGSFRDPLGTPSSAQRRPVAGYGIPWPSAYRRNHSSGGSAESGNTNDVLEDLEDLAEDLTERFALSLRSTGSDSASGSGSNNSVRSSSHSVGDGDVFGSGELADAPEGRYSSNRSGNPSGGSNHHGHASQYVAGSSSRGHSGWNGYRRGRGGEDGEDSDDDGRKRRPPHLPVSSQVVMTDSEEDGDSEDSGTDDYGEDSPSANRRRERHDTTKPRMPKVAASSASANADMTDDDVPLARQIPGALNAQRTIRRQVRDELGQKRAERRAREALRQQQQQGEQPPTRALSSAVDAPGFSTQQQNSPSRPVGRPRTRTLPGNMESPFTPGDLTTKLLGLRTASPTANTAPPLPPPSPLAAPRSKRPSFDAPEQTQLSVRGRNLAEPQLYSASASVSRQPSRPSTATTEGSRTLRPMRSFHRTRPVETELTAPPVPVSDHTLQSQAQTSASLQRSATSSRRRPAAVEELPSSYLATTSGLDRKRSTKGEHPRRQSMERTTPQPESTSAAMARTRSESRPANSTAAPASTFSQPGKVHGGTQMWQQRVFIGNMQRFCLVEIGSATSAGDVLNTVDGQGGLDQGAGSGGWMLWEVSQDFGMERPVRNFETLNDVCGAWNSDKTVNLLVIKKTLLAPLLSTRAMPSSSPVCSGYVQWEYKRGKWQKRWMELREHSLWLSKRDTGKDATFLCSLNNFDAYYVTRVHKAPKPYVFSVKSTDSLSYFEDTSDYVHVFSCGESEGKNWLEKILLARSYVLYQERNVVSAAAASSGSGVGGLQRAGTRKRPAQPLVNVGPPKSEVVSPNVFEPIAGSLLARR